MDFEIIKTELIKEFEKELKIKKTPHNKVSNFKDAADNFESASEIGKHLIEILNNVLSKNNVNFNKKEETKFEEFIKPTIEEYYMKFLNKIL